MRVSFGLWYGSADELGLMVVRANLWIIPSERWEKTQRTDELERWLPVSTQQICTGAMIGMAAAP